MTVAPRGTHCSQILLDRACFGDARTHDFKLNIKSVNLYVVVQLIFAWLAVSEHAVSTWVETQRGKALMSGESVSQFVDDYRL